jgi:Calcineurin-like phosphoesterase
VAIGDLHGDLAATLAVLKLSGAIDDAGHWAGGELTLVQTGDQIDRGDDDRAVLELFARLAQEAPKDGGRVIALAGNHELMNVVHDFRYVTPGSNGPFGGVEGRRQAFAPGGEFARMLAERPVVAQVGDSLFVHGGVLERHLRYGLGRMNREARAFMAGELPSPPAALVDPDAPVWTRAYSAEPGPDECAEAKRVLAALGAARMVVGHTVQADGINAACDGSVWRIDVGMSRAYGGAPQALELRGAEARVLR